MQLFSERPTFDKLNALILGLDDYSDKLICLGKKVLDCKDFQEELAMTQDGSVGDDARDTFAADSTNLLINLNEDYHRTQYVLSLLRFIARNYRKKDYNEYYADRGILSFTFGDNALTRDILQSIISKYDEGVIGDTKDNFGTNSDRATNIWRSNFISAQKEYDSMQTMSAKVSNLKGLVVAEDSLVAQLSKHYNNRKALSQVLNILAFTGFFLGLALFLAGSITNGTCMMPGFIVLVSSMFVAPITNVICLSEIQRHSRTTEFLEKDISKMTLGNKFKDFLDLCKNTDRKVILIESEIGRYRNLISPITK